MKQARKLIAILLSLALLLVLGACGSADDSPSGAGSEPAGADGANSPADADGDAPAPAGDSDEVYFVCPKNLGPVYWSLAEQGAQTAAAELGVEVIFNGPSEANSAKQINMIEDMLARGITGFAVSPNDAQAIKSVIADAQAEGVKVVTFDSDASDSTRSYFVGPASDRQIGLEMAAYVAEQIGYEGEVAFMCGGLAAENQVVKMEAAHEELAKYPDITVVTTLASNDDMQKSYENATTLLQTYPDLQAILGFTGGQAPAAAEVVEQAVEAGEMEAGQLLITGIGFPSNCEKYLLSGTIGQIFSFESEKMGYLAVYVLHALHNDIDLTAGFEVPMLGEVSLEDQSIWTGLTIITGENVHLYDF